MKKVETIFIIEWFRFYLNATKEQGMTIKSTGVYVEAIYYRDFRFRFGTNLEVT